MKISPERVLEGAEIELDLQISRQHFRNVRYKQPFLQSLLKASRKDTPALSKQTERVSHFQNPTRRLGPKSKDSSVNSCLAQSKRTFSARVKRLGLTVRLFPSREREWQQ